MNEKEYENSGQSQLIKKIKDLVDYQEEDKYCIFDKVSVADARQEKIYNEAAKPIIKAFLKGYNGAIIALGTTSEKIHVLEGDIEVPEKHGIIPRFADELFEFIYSIEEDIDFHIKMSYLEVYRDKIRDLLDRSKRNLLISEDKNRIPYVASATWRFVTSKEEFLEVFNEGKLNRDFIDTNDYEHICLSHGILLIELWQNHNTDEKRVCSKLYIVDIAGSEKLNKSGMEGIMFEETKHINKSLSALLHVITSLSSGAKSHIPYRDTKLTRILQDSFSGNSKISFIICFPAESINRINSEPSWRARKNDVTDSEEVVMLKKRLKSEKEKTSQLRNQLSQAEEKLQKYEIEKAKPEERKILERLKEVNLLLAKPCKDCELSRQEMHRYKQENDRVKQESESTKEEMKKVVKLVEDLTNNYEIKSAELDKKSEEYWQLMEEHGNLLSTVNRETLESSVIREEQSYSLATFLKDLGEFDSTDETELITLHRKEYDSLKEDRDKLQDEMNTVRQENDMAKEEVREVLQALEELAINYDMKNQEMDKKYREFEELSEVLSQKQSCLNTTNLKLEELVHQINLQKKTTAESLQKLLNDLGDIGVVLGTNASETNGCKDKESNAEVKTLPKTLSDYQLQIKKVFEEPLGSVEEGLLLVRLYVARLNSAAQSLSFKCKALESSQKDKNEKIDSLQKTLTDCQLQITRHEVEMKFLNENIREVENKKINLEEEVDSLNEECAKLKLKNYSREIKEKTKDINAEKMQKTLEDYVEKYKEVHQKQLAQLRNEMAEKNSKIDELRAAFHKLSTAHEHLQLDYDKMKQDELDKTHKLEELISLNERKEQARQDLKGLEDTVAKELQTLHNSRKLFVQDLQSRIAKSVGGDSDDELSSSAAAQKQKITFLENNLEELTKVHKQLVRDNAELRCELPKLEKRLRATMERAKSLEQALRDSKEAMMRDRKRYQYEVDRIKMAVRQKSLWLQGERAVLASIVQRPEPSQTQNEEDNHSELNQKSESNKNNDSE